MHSRFSLPLIVGVSLLAPGLVACGDDGNTDAASDETGDGDGDPTTGDGDGDGDGDPTTGDGDGDPTTGDGDGDPTTGDGDGDPTTGDGDGDPTTGDGDGDPAGCQVWEITYDLVGSEFEISGTPFGAGDQVNVVADPDDADDEVGPGNFVLRFQDVDGSPGGQAFMHTYEMGLHFLVTAQGANVATDLDSDAGPVECGITSGPLDAGVVAWDPSAIVGHHNVGQILCNGNLCQFGGLPNGMAVPVDEVVDQPLNDFEFNNDLTSFSMASVVVQMDDNSTTTWVYQGTETSRELVDAPDCLCQ